MHQESGMLAAALFAIGLCFLATKKLKGVAYVLFGAGALFVAAGLSG